VSIISIYFIIYFSLYSTQRVCLTWKWEGSTHFVWFSWRWPCWAETCSGVE